MSEGNLKRSHESIGNSAGTALDFEESGKRIILSDKGELGTVKKFLMEKLGYQVIVNPYLVKVEKMPATPENWMGIQEFTRKIEYVFFCMILMFLEEKEAEEQFVLQS